ncbi:MAG: TetR/AcrR family transcriptional regulator [Parvularculaceae bacterium]
MPLEKLDDTAREILEAASKRFQHYGYCKTTMSEIAKDCNMSTGNLYRYFPSKLDIAETFVGVLRREQIAKLKLVLEEPGLTPAKRLRRFLHVKFKLAYDRFHDRPKAFELSLEILQERPAFAVEWERAEREVLKDVLAMGDADGSFVIADTDAAAQVIQNAAYRFTSPSIFHEGEFEDLSRELDQVTDLILDAFAWRARTELRAAAAGEPI